MLEFFNLPHSLPEWIQLVSAYFPFILFGIWEDPPEVDPPPATYPPESPPSAPATPVDGEGATGGYAISVSTTGASGSAATQVTISGSFTGNGDAVAVYRRYRIYNVSGTDISTGAAVGGGTQYSGSWTHYDTGQVAYDTAQYKAKAFVDAPNVSNRIFGAAITFKSYAEVATSNAPVIDDYDDTHMSVSCSFNPKTVQSYCTAQLQYKKTVDSTWLNLGTSFNTSGGTSVSLTRNQSGLTALTSYGVRLQLTRNTVNSTTLTSAVTTFTTLAGIPEVTTNAASSVSHNVATLNSTVTINNGGTVTAYWKYGIQTPPTDTTTASQAVSGTGAFSVATGALLANTLYYAQAFCAFATPTGSPVNGSVVSFTTSGDPAAEAADEDHMTIQEYDAVYGVQKAFVFLAASPSATSSNVFLSAAAPWATTECRITIDGGTVADCTNAPTRIGTSAFYTITLTAAELSGENIWVHINDTGAAARDVALHIRTSIEVGKMVLNAAQMTNTTALLATGIGSGHGISAVAGATGNDINGVLGNHVIRKSTVQAGGASSITLDASASATNDFYNGALVVVISGTGTAQSRFITDYDGSTKVATVHRAWSTNPASGAVFIVVPAEDVWTQAATVELSAVPTATSSWADKLQFVWQRFAYKRTQTATTHTMFKADSSTSLGTAAVSDDGSSQAFNKVS